MNPLNLSFPFLQGRQNRSNEQDNIPLKNILFEIESIQERQVCSKLRTDEVSPIKFLEKVTI